VAARAAVEAAGRGAQAFVRAMCCAAGLLTRVALALGSAEHVENRFYYDPDYNISLSYIQVFGSLPVHGACALLSYT
jgi:hypothetical protein